MARRQTESVARAPNEQATAAYLRVSTDEQKRSGLGLEAQRKRVLAMALVKDWPEPVVYCDEGISGTKESAKRPGLAELLAACHAGRYQAVIIPSLDRLGRKTRLILELVDELTRAGVSLVSCKESLDTTTPTGQFVLTLFAALAQLERDLIAERTRAALAVRGSRDGDKGGQVPYGYVRTSGGVRIERGAAIVVRRIFALHASGCSLRKIAAQLAPPSPRGGAWRHTGVAEILSNRAIYEGSQRGASTLRWPIILHDPLHAPADLPPQP